VGSLLQKKLADIPEESKTESECLFERFCKVSGIHFKRIVPDGQKIPDYDIFVGEQKIVVEVKQMEPEPNGVESQKIDELNNSGMTTIKTEPGERVRNSIRNSQGKFKKAKNKYPTILVLYDNVKYHKHTEPFEILTAMYGQPYIAVEYMNSSVQVGNMKLGPKRKMTTTTNTSISAIGVLKKGKDGSPNLTVFHNKYAGVPLELNLLAKFSIKQYTIKDMDNSIKWEGTKIP
jgi:hypothetical protein